MSILKRALTASALFLSVSTAANAAVVGIFTNGSTFDSSSVTGTFGEPGYLTINWNGVMSGGSTVQVFMMLDSAFEVALSDYSDQDSASNVSAFTLDTTDGFMGGVTGRIGGVTDDCAILGADCFVVTRSTGTGRLVPLAAQPGDTIVSGLGAGSYLLTFGESGMPESGSATLEFRELAAVPLPAAGFMLLAGLGGLAVFRRRKA